MLTEYELKEYQPYVFEPIDVPMNGEGEIKSDIDHFQNINWYKFVKIPVCLFLFFFCK